MKTRDVASLLVATVLLGWAGSGWAQPPPARGGRASRLMAAHCAKCHGPELNGNGPASTELLPPPANLTLVREAPRMAMSIVHHGVPGTAMPAFPRLNLVQNSRLGIHLKRRPDFRAREWEVPTAEEQRAVSLREAAAQYQKSCAGCHGAGGRGDGAWAKGDPHIWPKPANFHARSSETERLNSILGEGRPGTMMSPYAWQLPAGMRWALAKHVRSAFSSLSLKRIQWGTKEFYRNPLGPSDAAAVARGRELYQAHCQRCHGPDAAGTAIAPALNDRTWRFGAGSDTAVFTIISKGIPGQIMPAFSALPPEERWSIISYERSAGGLPDPRLQ